MTDCNIIRDLLTLYADDLCSPQSAALVEEHLPLCPHCANLLKTLRSPDTICSVDEKAAFQQFSRTNKKRNLKKIALSTITAVISIVLLAALVWIPEMPIRWYDGLAEARIPADGGINIYITENYKNAYAVYADKGDGSFDVYITAVDNIVTMLVPTVDETVSFVRLGNDLCVSYKNVKNGLLFQFPEDTDAANIYYVRASEKQLIAASMDDTLDSLPDRVLLWNAD